MPLSLTEIESRPAAPAASAPLATIQQQLGELQSAQAAQGKRLLVLLDGWAGAGKKSALRALAAALDPCLFAAHSALDPQIEGTSQHWLAPFWARLPEAGRAAFFHHSWYRLAVDRRVAGHIDERRWSRCLDEINELEAQQADHDTLVVKLIFHLPASLQQERLSGRVSASSATADSDPRVRDAYLAAWQQMIDRTDTRWAPWRAVDASDESASAAVALQWVADGLQSALLGGKPPEKKLFRMARERFA